MRKQIGKIKSVCVGKGGYQNAMFGISFELGGPDWTVGDFEGAWGIKTPPHDITTEAGWTEKDRTEAFSLTMRRMNQLICDAKVDCIAQLVNIPIEATFEGQKLQTWRILTEAI